MIKDIYLRNNYDRYLDKNRSMSADDFYRHVKVKLFSLTGKFNKFRIFYKVKDNNIFISEVLRNGKTGYFKF